MDWCFVDLRIGGDIVVQMRHWIGFILCVGCLFSFYYFGGVIVIHVSFEF